MSCCLRERPAVFNNKTPTLPKKTTSDTATKKKRREIKSIGIIICTVIDENADFTRRLQSVRPSRSRAASKCGKIIDRSRIAGPSVVEPTTPTSRNRRASRRVEFGKRPFLVLRV